MTDKIRVWQDIRFCATAELEEYSCLFKAYQLLWLEDGVPVANLPGGSSPNPAPTLEEAQVFLAGHIKWDGCSDWYDFDQCWHFCSSQQASDVGLLFARLYEWASQVIPRWEE